MRQSYNYHAILYCSINKTMQCNNILFFYSLFYFVMKKKACACNSFNLIVYSGTKWNIFTIWRIPSDIWINRNKLWYFSLYTLRNDDEIWFYTFTVFSQTYDTYYIQFGLGIIYEYCVHFYHIIKVCMYSWKES